MLYQVLGAKYKHHECDFYLYVTNKGYIKAYSTGIEIYLKNKENQIYTLYMWYYKEFWGASAHGFNSIIFECYGGIFDSYHSHLLGLYTLNLSDKDVLKNIELEVKDKGNDLVHIHEGSDIKNHLFTCIKYSGDTYYSEGMVKLEWDMWEEI